MLLGYQEGTGIMSIGSTLEKDIELCEKVGFDVIEMRYDHVQRYLLSHSYQDLRDLFAGKHLKPRCMGGLWLDPNLFINTTPEGKDLDRTLLDHAIGAFATAQQVGDPYVLVMNAILHKGTLMRPMDVNDRDYPYSEEQVTDFTVRIMHQLCSIAQDFGVSLAMEPICGRGGSVKTMEHAMKIIDAVGYKNIGLCTDSYNQYINNKTNDFSIYKDVPAERIITAHINSCDDMDPETLLPIHRCFCGEGVIDTVDYVRNLIKIGYEGPFSIEAQRLEYGKWEIDRVIEEAYRTTRACIEAAAAN